MKGQKKIRDPGSRARGRTPGLDPRGAVGATTPPWTELKHCKEIASGGAPHRVPSDVR